MEPNRRGANGRDVSLTGAIASGTADDCAHALNRIFEICRVYIGTTSAVQWVADVIDDAGRIEICGYRLTDGLIVAAGCGDRVSDPIHVYTVSPMQALGIGQHLLKVDDEAGELWSTELHEEIEKALAAMEAA